VYSLLAEADGSLWIGYIYGGVSVLRNGRLHTFDRAALPPGSVKQFFRDPDGVLWISSTSGLARLDGDRWRIADQHMSYPGESPQWLGMVGGRFGVVTHSATFLYSTASRSFERRPRLEGAAARYGIRPGSNWYPDLHDTSEEDPYQSLLDREGSLWLSGFRTLLRYQWTSRSAGIPREDRFTTEMGLTGDVRPIMEDREGNIWAGTEQGLDRFSPATLQRLLFADGAYSPLLIPGDQGDLWVARTAHPIVRVGQENQPIAALGRSVTTAFRRQDGTLWTAGQDGVFEYARGAAVRKLPLPVSVEQVPEIAASPPAYQAIAVDEGGAVWLSIAGAGLFRWDGASWAQPQLRYGLPSGPAIRMVVDRQGRLWIAYPDNRLAVVEGERVTLFTHADGLNVGNVVGIDVKPTHTWISGDRGVAALVGKRFIALRGRGEVDFHMSSGILETGRGELWLNAAEGIYRVPAAEVSGALAGSSRPVEFEAFDWLEGVNGVVNAVRPLPSMLQTADGRLWFARYDGVWSIDPDHIHRNLVPPIVQIESLVAGGVGYPANTPARLPKNTRSLRIDYTAASLTYPERTRFRYQLLGVDEEWQEAGQRRQAFYTNLGPGQYEFRVMAANKDGVWSARSAMLQFTVAPAFYQTLVFKICAAVATGLLLLLLFRVRLEQIHRRYRRSVEARHSERERIARDVHDTLLQGAQAMLFRLQMWEADPAVPDPLRKEMGAVAKHAKSAVIEGRERIAMMRKADAQPEDLNESLAAMGCEAASLGQGAAFDIKVTGEGKSLVVDVKQQLLDIAREAVRNAYQHAGAARIEVCLQYGRRSLLLSIADDGGGFDPASAEGKANPAHFGLMGMRERAKQLGARFRIQSRIGMGTRIEVVIPAAVAFRDAFKWPWERRHARPIPGEAEGNAG
jgi:signal transduction histidine kinase/streptogramin lyase